MSDGRDEPLLPVEKRLIAGGLLFGAGLLGVPLWVSQTFFPRQPVRSSA